MTYPELAALESTSRELLRLLEELDPRDWEAPTRCPPLSVRQLVAHIADAQEHYNSLLGHAHAGPATTDRARWWRYREQPGFDARQRQRWMDESTRASVEGRTDTELVAAVRSALDRAVDGHRATDPGQLLGRDDGPGGRIVICARELCAVAVIEAGIHTMDVGHAGLRGERMSRDATQLIAEALARLSPVPIPSRLGWTTRTFILTASGRRPLKPTEKQVLGQTGARFPLLA